MGKSQARRFTSLKLAEPTYKISKSRKAQSLSLLQQSQSAKIKHIHSNFRLLLRQLMSKGTQQNQTEIISFLNIVASNQDICSFGCIMPLAIPSIQYMISENYINPLQQADVSNSDVGSHCSITHPFSQELIGGEPELPIYYMCLLERIFKKISCPLTKRQNQNVIKGAWNILSKFWRDQVNNCQLYKVHQKIEWGLLEIIGFKFEAGKKERFFAEQLLRIGAENQESQNRYYMPKRPENLQSVEERRHLCTLEYIE